MRPILTGTRVVVTRPAKLAESFCQRVSAAGGDVVSLPAIDIEPIAVQYDGESPLVAGSGQSYAIFISRNAVRYGSDLLRQLPDDTRCLAVGSKTAEALGNAGIAVAFHPEHGFTSEDLLDWPELQAMDGTQVFIFCGEGGRRLLGDTLSARGATVRRLEVYRRTTPRVSATELEQKLLFPRPDVVTITSVETLRNFLQMADKLSDFDATALAVIAGSRRIADAAIAAGFKNPPWVAANPSDDAMFETLLAWRQNETKHHDQGKSGCD